MFTLAEVASLNDIQPTYRILKPWWDVFMDYLAVVMLMVAIFAGTMQLTKDQVVCLPILQSAVNSEAQPGISGNADDTPGFEATTGQDKGTAMRTVSFENAPAITPEIPLSRATYSQLQSTVSNQELKNEKQDSLGRKTNLDYQQYVFINQMCYHLALPWYSKYFPYLALIHTIILMVSSNFWFKYPKTCSKIEHFVSILGKCFESPWTTKALSETACEDSEENKQRLTDQYDQLYSKRFGVFLSEVSENKLREISLNHEWTFEKLRQHVSRNAQDKQELHLFMLSGVPDAVFDLTDLDVLRLELIPEAKIPAKISQMTNLQELHLCHCPAKVEQTAFSFLRDNLRCLHVKFTDVAEIPTWVYLLKNLRELYLIGNLNSENNKMIGLESLRELRHLKILHVKSNLTKVPSNITDVAPHLTKLVIHNDGTKLVVLNCLKKMMNVAELELQNCELERIPHAIFSLTNLQDLDLKSNSIRTIEEVISFQHLKRLTCLKLWHNKIVNIPPSISHVKNLESLYLSNNKLESLPTAVFSLQKLRCLDVSYNSIAEIPVEIGLLQNLQHLHITGNKVDILPKQLFKCVKLRTLSLGQNCITSIPDKIGQLVQLTHLELKGNCLDRLPAMLGQCRLLRKSGLVVEDHLFDTLPSEVKDVLNQDTSITFANGI
ncbi:volume-regulated anion channel subunit LRRC8D isoform X2 [Carettochelys insculpta]|uniref:volume-regulated anion channel subunit LRRC8D isoform X2 n=1 Tax=Carettochelys insculpta TaxID=44489 RepID=UPI003EB73293